MSDVVEQRVLEILEPVLARTDHECRKCRIVKPLTEFYKEKSGKPRSICKACWKAQNQRWRHNLSQEGRAHQLDLMAAWPFVFADGSKMRSGDVKAQRERQGGRCALCGVELIRGRNVRDSQQVEHNHTTMQPRALTCKACNQKIGHFEQVRAFSPEYTEKLEDYLANPPWQLPPVDTEAVRRRMRHRGHKPRTKQTAAESVVGSDES